MISDAFVASFVATRVAQSGLDLADVAETVGTTRPALERQLRGADPLTVADFVNVAYGLGADPLTMFSDLTGGTPRPDPTALGGGAR